jgi:hypothetical protein
MLILSDGPNTPPSQPQATDQRTLELLQTSKAIGNFFCTDEAMTRAIAAERIHTQLGVDVGMHLTGNTVKGYPSHDRSGHMDDKLNMPGMA